MALGYPEYGVRFGTSMEFATWAESCGGLGIRVEKPGDVEPAIREAFTHRGPALVDVVVNPDEPPMPGKVRYDDAVGFAQSFLKGQPRRAAIASTLFRDKLDQLRS
jgi:pyruvate dehydrogenase (quinone)/pyruvate oxidase